jgi:hypothetical protein
MTGGYSWGNSSHSSSEHESKTRIPGEEHLLSIEQMAISTPFLPCKRPQPIRPAARVKKLRTG